MARVERSETAGRGSAVMTRDASETRSGIPRRSIAPRIAVGTAGSGRTTNGRETGHARQARRRDATNSSRGAMRGRFGEARRATARQGARREETDPEGVLVYAERVGLTAPRPCRREARRAKPDACWKARHTRTAYGCRAKPDACWKARRKSLWLWRKSLWSFRAPGGARFSSTCPSRRPIPITGSRPSPSRSRSWSDEKWLSACRVAVRQGPTSCRPLPITPPTLADGLMHN